MQRSVAALDILETRIEKGWTRATARVRDRAGFWLLAAAAAMVGLGARLWHYTEAPAFYDNADEMDWVWTGYTLITRGRPEGWTLLSVYPHVDAIKLFGRDLAYPFVTPYLDHPPLFSLLAGGWGWMAGVRGMDGVTAAVARPPAIGLSILALLLMAALGRRVLGDMQALVAAALLSTAPAAILLGRELESEALLAVLLLAALLACIRLLDGDSMPAYALLGACAFLAPMTKVPGIAIGLSCAVSLALDRRWRPALVASFGAMLGLAAFAGYGVLMGHGLFITVFRAQSIRHTGINGVYEFLVAPSGIGGHLRDGWWLLGLLGATWLGLRPGSLASRYVAWPVIAYALAIGILGDDTAIPRYGWYRVTVYPLVYLAAAELVTRAIAAPSLVLQGMWLAFGGTSAATHLKHTEPGGWKPAGVELSAVAALGMAPAAIGRWGRVRLAAALSAVLLALMLLGNLVQDLYLPQIYRDL